MFSAKGSWPLALLSGALYCVNLWLGAQGLAWPTILLVLALFGAVVAAAFVPAARRYLPALFFMSVVGFPQYSADPYAAEFVAPFSFAKFVALSSLLLMCKPAPSKYGMAFFGLVVLATIAAALSGRIGNVWAEVWYVFLIVFALNVQVRPSLANAARLLLGAMERLFYLLIPLAMFTLATGLTDERSGGTVVYFYGHWVGIATAFAIYAASSRQSTVFGSTWIRISLMVTTFFFCIASYQSGHFVLIIIALLIVMAQRRHEYGQRSVIFLPVVVLATLLVSGAVILARGETDSWLFMKVSQLFLLGSGGFIEGSNSVLIRVSELISMFEQGNLWTILFGRGAFSTYLAEGAFWDIVIFHKATFPEREILAGELQYIHEPVVMLLKWVGLVGLGLACLGMYRLRQSVLVDRVTATLVAVVLLMFFASSLQTGFLITGLFVLSNGFKRHVPTKNRHKLLG